MIAVFAESHTRLNREGIILYPKSIYKIIKNEDDIIGRQFESLICLHFWYKNPDVYKAYYELEKRQPELFK